jgi:hypothetical protein
MAQLLSLSFQHIPCNSDSFLGVQILGALRMGLEGSFSLQIA